MVCWQATVQIENIGDTVETEEIKSVMSLCKNNLLFDKLESQRLHVVTTETFD